MIIMEWNGMEWNEIASGSVANEIASGSVANGMKWNEVHGVYGVHGDRERSLHSRRTDTHKNSA